MLISMYVGEVLVVEFQQDVHISFIRLLTCVVVSFDDWLRSIRNHTTAQRRRYAAVRRCVVSTDPCVSAFQLLITRWLKVKFHIHHLNKIWQHFDNNLTTLNTSTTQWLQKVPPMQVIQVMEVHCTKLYQQQFNRLITFVVKNFTERIIPANWQQVHSRSFQAQSTNTIY